LTVDTTGAGSAYTGAIAEPSGAVALTVNGDDVFILGGSAKAYTGKTTVDGTAHLALGAADLIGASTDFEVTTNAIFNLNGFDQTIVQLNGAGTVTNFDIADAGSNANTLTITGDTGVFTGALTDGTAQGLSSSNDTLALTKSTAGTQTLSAGAGNYSGALSVTGGTLAVTTAASFGNATGSTVVSGGGILQLGGAMSVADALSITGGECDDGCIGADVCRPGDTGWCRDLRRGCHGRCDCGRHLGGDASASRHGHIDEDRHRHVVAECHE